MKWGRKMPTRYGELLYNGVQVGKGLSGTCFANYSNRAVQCSAVQFVNFELDRSLSMGHYMSPLNITQPLDSIRYMVFLMATIR